MIDFLKKIFNEGRSYSSLNSDRSAIALIADNDIGNHKLVCRALRGCFKIRPSLPCYEFTWDVKIVFKFIESAQDSAELDFEMLTKKLVLLLALATAQRAQTLAKIKISNISRSEEKIEIVITDILKSSRPGFQQPRLIFYKFLDRPKLCVLDCLNIYIERSQAIRGKVEYLFLSTIRPYRAITSQTISRWIKNIMEQAGINISIFKAHSTRHASTSATLAKGIDLATIKKTAGWSDCERSKVFAKYYNRPVIDKTNDF